MNAVANTYIANNQRAGSTVREFPGTRRPER